MIDFRGVSSHFADPEFDGEPVEIYEPDGDDKVIPRGETDFPDEEEEIEDDEKKKRKKVYVDGVEATIVAQTVQFLDKYGNLITESLRDYTRRTVRNHYASLDEFVARWAGERTKTSGCRRN